MQRKKGTVLPPHFTTYEDYAQSLVTFLKEHEHLFNLFYYETKENHKETIATPDVNTVNPRQEQLTAVQEDKVVLFFVNQHWTKRIPQEWRNYFDKIHQLALEQNMLDDLFQFLLDLQSGKMEKHSDSIFTQLCPESFLKYVKTAQSLKMYNPLTDPQQQASESSVNENHNKELIKTLRLLGMNDKKTHEIEKLGNAIIEFAHESNCQTVVDLGAGQGYLSQYIAFCQSNDHDNSSQNENKEPLNVIAIDGNELQTSGCEKRVSQIKNKMEKSATNTTTATTTTLTTTNAAQQRVTKKDTTTVHSVTAHLTLTISQDEFIHLLKPYIGSEANKSDVTNERILLIGLHTCGDLAATMIRLFLKTSAVSLANVACCYHKLTEDPHYCAHEGCCSQDCGYPMSSILNKQQNKLPLSAGKYLASNSDPEFSDVNAAKYMFKMHSYRAALELFLNMQIQPEFPESHFSGCIRPQHTSSFGKYALAAMKKMQPKHETHPFLDKTYKTRLDSKLKELFSQGEEALMEQLNEFYRNLKPLHGDIVPEVQCFAAIRQVLSPVIEALILVDRLLYLREQDNVESVELIRVFHPKISPRGVILTATKKV